MKFREVLFRHILAGSALSYPLYYGSSPEDPAFVMQLVTDGERPDSICKTQGQTGDALVQFMFVASVSKGNWNQFLVENQLEILKDYVSKIDGSIVVSGNS
jgi:hypothetical protein